MGWVGEVLKIARFRDGRELRDRGSNFELKGIGFFWAPYDTVVSQVFGVRVGIVELRAVELLSEPLEAQSGVEAWNISRRRAGFRKLPIRAILVFPPPR